MRSIVRGNDFLLRIPVRVCKEGEVTELDLTKCEDVRVTLVSAFGSVTPEVSVSATDSSVLLARMEGTALPNGLFSVEVTGAIDGARWRSERARQLRIVETDGEADFCATDKEGMRVEMEAVTIGDIVITSIQPGVTAQVLPITNDYIDGLFT